MQPYFYINYSLVWYICNMYLYNVSIITEDSVNATVVEWLKAEILSQSTFNTKFLELLDSPHEGHTHCIQIIVENESEIELFNEKHLIPLQEYIASSFHGRAFVFNSVMKYL